MDTFLIGFIVVIVYVIMLFLLKKTGFKKKKKSNNCMNCCPDCMAALSRVQRKTSDHFIHHITFRIFDCRRYICSNCGWEGLRWEEKFTPKKN